jgi:hypothetical protein
MKQVLTGSMERGCASPRVSAEVFFDDDARVKVCLRSRIVPRGRRKRLLQLQCLQRRRRDFIPAWVNGPGFRFTIARAESPIHWRDRDGTGFQPSCALSSLPGPLAQAGMVLGLRPLIHKNEPGIGQTPAVVASDDPTTEIALRPSRPPVSHFTEASSGRPSFL